VGVDVVGIAGDVALINRIDTGAEKDNLQRTVLCMKS